MHSRFNELRKTALGQELESLLSSSKKYVEYAALSRAGLPAIAAAVHEIEEQFPVVRSDQAARQFCGAVVGEVMRDAGHEILRPRGRVIGNLFTYGTVWTPFPIQKDTDQIVKSMSGVPRRLSAMLGGIPLRLLRVDLQKDRTPISNRVIETIYNDVEFYQKLEGKPSATAGTATMDGLLSALTAEDGTLKVDEFCTQFENGREKQCKTLFQHLKHPAHSDRSAPAKLDHVHDAIRQAHDADQVLLTDLQEFILELSFGS